MGFRKECLVGGSGYRGILDQYFLQPFALAPMASNFQRALCSPCDVLLIPVSISIVYPVCYPFPVLCLMQFNRWFSRRLGRQHIIIPLWALPSKYDYSPIPSQCLYSVFIHLSF